MLEMLRRYLKRRSASPSRPGKPRLPDGVRVYAIGDVHGRSDCLREILSQIQMHESESPAADPRIILLGDLIDRGPDSAEIIDLLCHPPLCEGFAQEVLLGNHEHFLLQFLENPGIGRAWLPSGGLATLVAYDIDCLGALTDDRLTEMRDALAEKLPAAHRRFLEQRPTWLEIGDYLFVHAGIRPGIPLEEQRLEDLLWIREPFLSAAKPSDRVVVHGHNISSDPELRPGRIGIDTGAYHSGVLTCVVLEGEELCLLQTQADSVRRAARRSR